MSFPLKGVDIHELPEDLKRYIQEKSASGLGKLKLMNLAFPVFIMNPFEYKDNFKATLNIQKLEAAADTIVFDSGDYVPSGEIWEINNIYCQTDGAASICILQHWDGSNAFPIKREFASKHIQWNGHIFLDEGRTLRAQMPLGALLLNCIGVKRYR